MAEIIGIASGVAGLVTVAMKVTELSYGYITDIRSAQSTQKQYLRELSALTDVLLRSEEALQAFDGQGDDLERTAKLPGNIISDCSQQLQELRSELEKPSPSIFWPLKEKTLKKHLESIHRFRSIFSDFLTAQTLVVTSATHREVARIGQHQDLADILRWIGDGKETSRAISPPLGGTGGWFLMSQKYQQWAGGTGSSILWCHGPPGVGKSVLATIALQNLTGKLQLQSDCVVHYFCDFANRKEQKKDDIWRSLLIQGLSQADATTVEALKRLHQRSGHLKNATSSNLHEAILTLCSSQRVVLILDGPDELENVKDTKAIIAPFVKANCNILITSRDIPEIRSTLTTASILEVEADISDLRAYTVNQFRENDLDDVLEDHPDLEDLIVDKANRIFLILKLLMKELIEKTTVKQMRKAIQSYSAHLDQAFESSLDRINAQSKSQRTLAYRVIGWIVTAERKLQMGELIHGLATEEASDVVNDEDLTTPKIILKVCGGLVVANSDDGTIGMIHSTFYTWLKQRDGGLQHEDMARSCLQYLTLRSLATGPTASAEEMHQRLAKFPFLVYSSQNWQRHIVGGGLENALAEDINRLLNNEQYRSAAFQVANYHHHVKDAALRSAVFEAMPSGHSALHVAAYWNLPHKVSELLAREENPNVRDSQNWTPLHWACFNNSREVIPILLSDGASIDAKDASGWTPIFWPALNGDVAITKFLLDKGASYAEQDNHGWTALRWATAKQHPDVIMAFLDHHTKVVSSDETSAPKLLKHSTLKDILHLKTVENKPLIELINETGATDLTENTFEDLFTRMQDASFDAAKLWKSGYFDPPVGNAWRTQRKAEYLRTDFYLRRPPSMESKKWNSALVHRAIRDGNLMALKLLLELGTDINAIVDRTPLHAAAFRRDPTFAQVLIENGSDIEALDYQGMTPLQQAVVNGFEETAEFLLSKGANINVCNPSDGITGPKKYKLTSSKGPASCRTPLMLACGLDGKSKDPGISVRMARMLLKAGADVNQKDALPEQMSVIHYAIRAEEPSLIETIIEAGADPRALDSLGRTGIHHLVLGSRWRDSQYERRDNLAKCFKILCERCGLDYLSRSAAWEESHLGPDNSYEWMMAIYTPIALAIRSRHWELFHKLHKLGARFETNAPLAGMMRESLIALQVDAVDILITHGASVPSNHEWIKNNITLRPGYKTTPDKIQRLIKILPKVLPAGFDEKDRELGAWLLHMAATKENTIELVRELLNLRADPFAREDGGMDSFITAWIYKQYDILRVLLAHAQKSPYEEHWTSHLNILEGSEEAEIAEEISRALNKAGSIDSVCHPSTLLCEAAVMGIPLIIETLLKHGADPSLVNEKGLSPLHLAASMGYVDCVKKLIEADVNLNQRNSTKRTALHLAAEAGHTEVVELLVSNGADLGATDTDGWQPLHFASIRERKDIAKCLIHSGASVLAPTIRWSQELVSRRPSGFSLQQPWIGNPLHLAVMSGDVDIVKEILATHEVDVNARVDDSQHETSGVPIIPGAGPTALRIALDTGSFDRKYGRALDRNRLEIAALLVEHGADVQGAGDHLTVADVRRFEEFEELWDKIRIGITDTN